MPHVVNGGVKIHYEMEGEGPFVILQTGAAGDSNMWRQAGFLRGLEGFTSILLDHRGHGNSDRPIQLDLHRMEYYVSDVLAVMDSLHVDKAAFIGYSDGGRVGFELAISHPDRITCLISVSSTGMMNEEELQGRDELAASIRANGVPELIGYFEEAEGIRFPDWLRNQFLTTDAEMFALELIGWKNWPSAWSRLAGIRVPVMIIVGEKEDPEGFASEAVKLMPKGKAIVLPDQGHIGAFLAVDDVLTHLMPFLVGNMSNSDLI